MRIEQKRLVQNFIDLVRIDSPTFDERQIIDYLKKYIEDMGLEVYEDNANLNTKGNAGNLIVNLEGLSDIPPIMFAAHVDNVSPCKNIRPIVEGDIIKSDGTTVLGGDDLAGVAMMLELIHILKENPLNHGTVQFVFTVSEEGGLFGSKNLDYSRIFSEYAFVLDGGDDIGRVAIKAPFHNELDITVNGKAAHAGLEPEKGVDAIKIAALAISKSPIGRIDDETTANIGKIEGGIATNIVCDKVFLKGEVRSLNRRKMDRVTDAIIMEFKKAAAMNKGNCDVKVKLAYNGYDIYDDDKIVRIINQAARSARIPLILEATGGGSDTNIFNSQGIKAVDLSVGMRKVHTVNEYIKISDMVKGTRLLEEIVRVVAGL